jgi:hypothetical protein
MQSARLLLVLKSNEFREELDGAAAETQVEFNLLFLY